MPITTIVAPTPDEAGAEGARVVAAAVRANPTLRTVIATGNTPMGLYARLAASQDAGELDLRSTTVFQLDEYVGVADHDPRSLYGWMDRSFLRPLNIPATHVRRFGEAATDPARECAAYARTIEDAGGFDLAILGLGPNGHLGFNEPPSDAAATTRIVDLTTESVVSNAAYWGDEDAVPRRAMTVGMDALIASRKIVLLAFGERKHDILRCTLEGPVTPDVPASFLQRAADVVVIADAKAAAWRGSPA